MRKKFIPIVGTISAGKSTFLQGLLGTSVLQSGSTTTTKFVCLIQNSKQTKFYHVIPKKEKVIKFIKQGEEIVGEEKIKQKIKDINETLSKKPGTKDDIFYVLETPIKNFNNPTLLEECYFMDIPGLNENKSSYIDIIFSLLTLDDIKLEIMVFDSTSIGSDNILDIIQKLDKMNCLKKSGNLFILNKIDQATQNTEEDIIDSFKQYFYQNFEDDKNEKTILININENKFVPMNSLFYLYDTKFEEDFDSMLNAEYLNFISPKNKGQFNSFFDYLKREMEDSIENSNSQGKRINIDVKAITSQEEEIIKKTMEEFINAKKNLGGFLNININRNKKDIYKLFLLHKNKAYLHKESKYYIDLQNIIKELGTNSDDLTCPPPNSINTNNVIDIKALDEFETFLKETFKKIDPNNELDSFQISLHSLREGIIGRKIRIAFIGNISVGKSSVLNSIIGKDLLPTNDKECTYRGIIIRHVPSETFRLYKTNLETRGVGIDEYYYFIDQKRPYCQSVEKIKSYLNNKNNDKKINDKDAYLVITGPLKIFEFIKLDQDIISKIEFIDLPGLDRKNNVFNDGNYYKKILRFSNCCIYINEPKTIDDKGSVEMMTRQYESDKQKIFPKFRAHFIKTCLFLFNKSDQIESEQDKIKLEDRILKNIAPLEKNLKRNDMNISYFSGKFFLKYLKVYYLYVDLLEKKPYYFILNLYDKYNKKFSRFFKSFKTYIIDKISKIEERFSLEDIELVEAPENFKTKIINEVKKYEKMCKYKLLKDNDYDEVIERLYNVNKNLKKANLSNTYYSPQFFFDLKKAIENSQNLFKENFQQSFEYLFENLDMLFDKELKLEAEGKIFRKKSEIINLKTVKQIIEEEFKQTKNNIKKLFADSKKEVSDIIDSEISNISQRLKEVNKNLEEATKKLQGKINQVIEKLKEKQKEEIIKLTKKIEKAIQKKFEEKEVNISSSNIDTNKGLTSKMIVSLIASTITGIAIRTGLAIVGESILAGAAAGAASTTIGTAAAGAVAGPVGIAVGVGVGLTISLTTFLVHVFSKEKRYEKGLKDFKEKMASDMDEAENNCFEDFKTFEDEFTRAFDQKFAVLKKDIDNIGKEEWAEMKKTYNEQKNQIKQKFLKIK